MIFIILIALGLVGIGVILWSTSARVRSAEYIIPRGSEWFAISPDTLESSVSNKIQVHTREFLKVLLRFSIKQYREISRKITLKQEIKKRVRAFLYEHRPDGKRNPSEFWNQVAPSEIASSLDQEPSTPESDQVEKI